MRLISKAAQNLLIQPHPKRQNPALRLPLAVLAVLAIKPF